MIQQLYTIGIRLWDETSNTFRVPTNENPITVKNNYYHYEVDNNIPLYDTLISDTKTSGAIIDSPKSYWLASRSVLWISSEVDIEVRACAKGQVMSRCFFSSDTRNELIGAAYTFSSGIRPIVTLKDSVKLDKSDSSKNGSSPTNAWRLK